MSLLKRFATSEEGPTATEYAVMLALIIIVALTAVTTPNMHTMATRIAAESLNRDIPIPSFVGFPVC